MQELDGLDFGYTSLLINHANLNHALNNEDRVLSIDYEAQFYAELRAYRDAKYGWILVKELSSCPHQLTRIREALLGDLNDIGPPLPPPRLAAIISEIKSPERAKAIADGFRRLNPHFPCFLLGFKHGDSIPHFRDAQAIISRTGVLHNMVPHRHVMPR
ncbi:hypothetical protein BOTBODRAFT_377166 [Botryobasidium botryosum FD-172 SS1]|uniref:Uncharacterized protein n=1 Tax=Botryobasidium botryosum (strain FD-172 SS1) TaxID=930990 RepID=A0A067N6N8_BOTB1|nr:hypothetical protein BOTBODRAFT_377166 [Botryobasidium botryosum FD-172 SS1]